MKLVGDIKEATPFSFSQNHKIKVTPKDFLICFYRDHGPELRASLLAPDLLSRVLPDPKVGTVCS